MKFIGRWLFRLVILAIVLAVAGLAFKDALLKEFIESRLRRLTGLELQIGSLQADLLTPVIRAENVRLYNPADFGGGPLLTAPLVHLEYDRIAWLRGEVLIPLLRVHIAELALVDAGGGRGSLPFLRDILARPNPPGGDRGREFVGIRVLNLTLDRVRLVQSHAPSRELVVDPGIRGVVIRNLRTAQNLDLLLAQIAQRAGALPAASGGSMAVPPR